MYVGLNILCQVKIVTCIDKIEIITLLKKKRRQSKTIIIVFHTTDGLLKMLSMILMQKPPRHAGAPRGSAPTLSQSGDFFVPFLLSVVKFYLS